MLAALAQLFLFTLKFLIILVLLLLFFAGLIAIAGFGREKKTGNKPEIRNLGNCWQETEESLLATVLPKKQFRAWKTSKKKAAKNSAETPRKKIYVLTFSGDIRASAVASLREEVTAILGIATPEDEIVVRLESGGGMVHAYGLATAQLQRIREKNIPLTVTIDRVAASGGYMMACVANRIVSAPFAMIGSIGVILQLPNFNRLLKEKNIDFEQLTAGNYKRTLTMFGQNTEEGREKMREEITSIHRLFKNLVQQYRPEADIEQVSTGEHWTGTEALALKLVDCINTSDDWLFSRRNEAEIYEIYCPVKKKLFEKLFASTGIADGYALLQEKKLLTAKQNFS